MRPKFAPSDKDKALPDVSLSKDGYVIKGRIWIEGPGGETFLGFGRVTLLQRIAEYGSISQAARSMDMSYKHAWDLVDSMNRGAGRLLVETSTGGKGGGGTRLTDAGREAIRLFWELYGEFKAFLNEKTEKFIF
ncbi:MAG: winged helix-turn-helix domain-containing protein [Dissulfurimicrobium sp.]|uniref:winged helix-turn-helix domain-containing protein n=1 Tax=Dissulfurimicrobium hydrothermale TaxID=1750598 RepID=UPI001EDBB324|nr:LysR family transcriptional regulator [Dissulfurimicrobium hydrothermale]UKL14292.1 LysR family transcriptional regulator [Dissulfurimicrobium hydrothermale]